MSNIKHIDSIMFHPDVKKLNKLVDILEKVNFFIHDEPKSHLSNEKKFENILDSKILSELLTHLEHEKYAYLIEQADAFQTLYFCLSHIKPVELVKHPPPNE